jgi:hypothetical protein
MGSGLLCGPLPTAIRGRRFAPAWPAPLPGRSQKVRRFLSGILQSAGPTALDLCIARWATRLFWAYLNFATNAFLEAWEEYKPLNVTCLKCP